MLQRRGRTCEGAPTTLEEALYSVVNYFNDSDFYQSTSIHFTRFNIKTLEPQVNSTSGNIYPMSLICKLYVTINNFAYSVFSQVQKLCLPFLRVAALLRYHLYEQPLPLVRTPQTEFVRLVYYLELVTEGMDWNCFNSAVALNWQDNEASTAVPRLWLDQFNAFVNRNVGAATSLISTQHMSWQVPKLLSLPREYEKIFTVRRIKLY